MTVRTSGYAAIARGERWTCRHCPGCKERRMMPETEERCLRCQESGGHRRQPRVLYLPGLRDAREWAGLSREELESLVGLSRYRLHLLEESEKRVKTRTARRIAAVLGTTVSALTQEMRGETALRQASAGRIPLPEEGSAA